ncbi:hypothetical protein [Hyphobacterium marinum]|uniref:Uncharacterized protein n=1 Tax=Hyphobacterium marinum TaxID=3116574 RepID=A0ABU7LWQ0_9PROT|nr:hypothetical protein [Hyphobacterium sp. Y6023]MEE2565906.1 hypothetical protein [Hyphobacterium sp. Y6023]
MLKLFGNRRASRVHARAPVLILATSSINHDVDRACNGRANVGVVNPVALFGLDGIVSTIKAFWAKTASLPGSRVNA